MEVERKPTYALDKNFSVLKKNFSRLLHISNILKMCPSSWFIISSSPSQLSAVFSMLLAGITHFKQIFFQHNRQLP